MKIKIFKNVMYAIVLVIIIVARGYCQVNKARIATSAFDSFAYSDAIKAYEDVIENGNVSIEIYQKLGDAYYFNGKLLEALEPYHKMFELSNDDIGGNILSEHLFRYAQTLKTSNELEKAKEIFRKWALINDNQQFIDELDQYGVVPTIKNKGYEVKQLAINSTFSDYSPVFKNGNLFFTSAREKKNKQLHHWTDEYFTSIFKAQLISNEKFEETQAIDIDVKDKDINVSTAVFSNDGRKVFFTANNFNIKGKRKRYNKEKSSLLKIYSADVDSNNKWVNVKELPINSDEYSTAHPALTPDEKFLYFSSDRQQGFGMSDLYRVSLKGLKVNGTIENLGAKINTSLRETFPYIDNYNTLYFASDARLGYGGLDLFKVAIDSDGNFGRVENLGEPYNSPYDDFTYYQLDRDNSLITSNRVFNNSDNIYEIYYCNVNLIGKALGPNINVELLNILVSSKDPYFNKAIGIKTNDNGEFILENIPCNSEISVEISSKRFKTLRNKLKTTNTDVNVVFNLLPHEVKTTGFKTTPLYYEFDKYNINEEGEKALQKVATILKGNPSFRLKINSHSDSRGGYNYNLKLSNMRSNSALEWLVKNQIDPKRIIVEGFGDRKPVNGCKANIPCSEEEHQLNRRSEFDIVAE